MSPGDQALRELDGFDAAAARAVELAGVEARRLGHDRVGTEHLLLGLLTNDSDATTLLAEAGVTLTAARDKVDEAVGAPGGSRRPPASLSRTARAERALGRSARFAHAAGSDLVTSAHVLLAVLDVEGTAGQVLRGLGIDVETLRSALSSGTPSSAAKGDERSASIVPRCATCDAALHELRATAVTARDDTGQPHDALVYSCAMCGHPVGAAPIRR